MRLVQAGAALLSGTIVYGAMIACDALSGGEARDLIGGAPDGDEGRGVVDALGIAFDVLTDPVPEAKAITSPPDIATEACDKLGTIGAATISIAVHDYPGKSVEDLSGLRALGHIGPSGSALTTDAGVYGYNLPSPTLRNGSAAVLCGQQFDTVTFILPAPN